jgi:hypothetical protein
MDSGDNRGARELPLPLLPTLSVSGFSSVKWLDEWWIVKDLEGSDHGLIEVLSGNFPGGTEKYHENLSISGVSARFKPNASVGLFRYSILWFQLEQKSQQQIAYPKVTLFIFASSSASPRILTVVRIVTTSHALISKAYNEAVHNLYSSPNILVWTNQGEWNCMGM